MLYIPDQVNKKPVTSPLTTGSTNAFVSNPPTVKLTHQFVGDDASTYASKAYTVVELDQLTGLTTDETGILTFDAPVTLETATVVFTDTGESWALAIGQLDPIDTLSGIFQRLQNLGYICTDTRLDSSNVDALRAGLRSLKAAESGGVAPDSTPASTPSPSYMAQAGDQSPTASQEDMDDFSPASDHSPDDSPASGTQSDSDAANGSDTTTDDAGLADDGALDADTTSLLLKAYGC